jgi:uncharacterized integral membrane protein
MLRMKILFWVVVLPLLFIAAFFAIANREAVTIDLWPVSGPVSVPLFVALVGALYLGFLFGALVTWWAGRATRAKARAEARRADRLQRDADELRARLDAATPPSKPTIEAEALPPRSTPPSATASWPVP